MPKELRLPSPGRKISLDIPFHRAAKAGLIDSSWLARLKAPEGVPFRSFHTVSYARASE
jgi:hypothetical protein